MMEYECCGNCKHWHRNEEQRYSSSVLGKCDKIPDGTAFEVEGEKYAFSSEVFADEVYTDCFGCFEKGGN